MAQTSQLDVMQLASEVHNFSTACERLLGAVAKNRPLTEEEIQLIEFYCKEMLNKAIFRRTTVEPRPPTSGN